MVNPRILERIETAGNKELIRLHEKEQDAVAAKYLHWSGFGNDLAITVIGPQGQSLLMTPTLAEYRYLSGPKLIAGIPRTNTCGPFIDDPEAVAYTITPKSVDGDANDFTAFLKADAHLAVDNLPAYCGFIESGEFSVPPNGFGIFKNIKLRAVSPLRDGMGAQVVSTLTGRPMRDFKNLPSRISHEVEPWRVHKWLREDLRMHLPDIIGRMHGAQKLTEEQFEHRIGTMSAALQMYQQKFGIFPSKPHPNQFGTSVQVVKTIADLTILQGNLNTCWDVECSNPSNEQQGPWVIRQPSLHGGYPFQERNGDEHGISNYKGQSYDLDMAYGLSDRKRAAIDLLDFCQAKFIEQILVAEEAAKTKALLRQDVRTERDERCSDHESDSWTIEDVETEWDRVLPYAKDNIEEFSLWLGGLPGTPSIGMFREALDKAKTFDEHDDVHKGDITASKTVHFAYGPIVPRAPAKVTKKNGAKVCKKNGAKVSKKNGAKVAKPKVTNTKQKNKTKAASADDIVEEHEELDVAQPMLGDASTEFTADGKDDSESEQVLDHEDGEPDEGATSGQSKQHWVGDDEDFDVGKPQKRRRTATRKNRNSLRVNDE